MNKKKCRAEICLATIFSTQALFTPVKTLFLLHFMMQTQDISFLKFVFTFASFVFELPSGHFSDKVGNKICLVCSRFLMIMSLLAYCMFPYFWGFVAANLILGIANAWESGAVDSYFLILCKQFEVEYSSLKITIKKISYLFNFTLMAISTLLYSINPFLPFWGTIILMTISLTIIIGMPKEMESTRANKALSSNFTQNSKVVLGKIVHNKCLLWKMLYTITCTAIYILNFEYYTVVFQKAGIGEKIIGPIYSTFMIINALGILVYQKNNFLVLKKLLLIVAPFSFVMLISYKVPLVLLAIFIQQMSFSYYNCDLDIFIINSIDDLTTSSYYQSMISFVNIIYRMIITLIITASFKNLSFNANYIGFTIILFIAYMIDHVLQRRLKNGH